MVGPLFVAVLFAHSTPAACWGDKGHEIVALIAERYLDPAARTEVSAMLTTDPDNLTAHDSASEATWADKYNKKTSSGRGPPAPCETCEWHFINIEIARPDLDDACFGHPVLPAGVVASGGPPHACIVDKLEQFVGELGDPATALDERRIALKFVLHLIGDLHQPLHVADDHDAGGNQKLVSVRGSSAGNLHFYWDVPLVERLGKDPNRIAARLVARISPQQRLAWSSDTVVDWAWETFRLAREHAYGLLLPPNPEGTYPLTEAYLRISLNDAILQLSKAGVRLAVTLNRAFRSVNGRLGHDPAPLTGGASYTGTKEAR